MLPARGEMGEAERHLRQELAIHSDYVPAHRNLALVLRAMKRTDEAASEWKRVLDLGSADREALHELFVFFQARDPARAEQYRMMRERLAAGRN